MKMLSKFTSYFLVLCLLMSISTMPVFATNKYPPCDASQMVETDTPLTQEQMDALLAFYVQEVEKARQNGGSYTYLLPGISSSFDSVVPERLGDISITRLLQTDLSWRDTPLNGSSSGATIGSAGCCVTSLAMILNYLNLTSSHTPATVNTTLGNNAAVFANSWASFYSGLQCVSYSSSGMSTNAIRLAVAQQLAQNQRPSAITVTKTSASGLHCVVSCGYTVDSYGNFDIVIVDPLNRTVNGSTYIPTMLSEYTYSTMFGGAVWLLSTARVFYY